MPRATKPKTRERVRDADRSRELILDAAEHLFAEKGYEETSLSDVGTRAGVSRATPGYFFGSKAELHRAVLERCFADVRRAVREGKARALASGETPDVILAGAVADYTDFVAARPNFVRLIEREALSDRTVLEGMPLRLAVWQEALAAWYRLAPAARTLARERAAGQLSAECFGAKLDTLVRLANLESVHELHTALRRGAVEVRAVVHDASSGRSELFDGTRFKPIDDAALADLIGRRRARELGWLGEDTQSGFHPVPSSRTRRHEESGVQECC